MDFLRALLQGLGTAVGAQAGYSVYQWTVAYFRTWGRKKQAREILQLLEDLGCRSENAVRQLVDEWAGGVKITTEQQEEVVGLLVNLVRGAHFLTTDGTPRSSYLRCEKLIDQLLANIQPAGRKGEPVGVGHDWRLERYLGMGTFGEVWLARNPYHPESRAYKLFTRAGAQDWVRGEQHNLYHIREKLGDHPHIMKFLDVGISGHERPFLALEYVGGGSLEDWILEDPPKRAPLNKDELIQGIVAGLAEAHRQQIYHRDLKPANILLTPGPDVQAKIADFGLAKVGTPCLPAGSAQLSQAVQVGTSMYLPPEAQEFWSERDPAKDDMFALGVLWYQLVVERLERPPYDFADRLQEHQENTHTVRLIARCLAREQRRFRDARELAEELIEVPPGWTVPAGRYDVQHLVREYLAEVGR